MMDRLDNNLDFLHDTYKTITYRTLFFDAQNNKLTHTQTSYIQGLTKPPLIIKECTIIDMCLG